MLIVLCILLCYYWLDEIKGKLSAPKVQHRRWTMDFKWRLHGNTVPSETWGRIQTLQQGLWRCYHLVSAHTQSWGACLIIITQSQVLSTQNLGFSLYYNYITSTVWLSLVFFVALSLSYTHTHKATTARPHWSAWGHWVWKVTFQRGMIIHR